MKRASGLAPDSADYRFRLGSAYNKAGRFREAVADLSAASKKMQGNGGVWQALGNADHQEHDEKDAREAYRHAVALLPNDGMLAIATV